MVEKIAPPPTTAHREQIMRQQNCRRPRGTAIIFISRQISIKPRSLGEYMFYMCMKNCRVLSGWSGRRTDGTERASAWPHYNQFHSVLSTTGQLTHLLIPLLCSPTCLPNSNYFYQSHSLSGGCGVLQRWVVGSDKGTMYVLPLITKIQRKIRNSLICM